MVSQNVNNLLRQAKSLTVEERKQFLELFQQETANTPVSDEQRLAAALAEKGIVMTIPPKPTAEERARFEAWKPVSIKGKPLSQTIVEERR